jgi:hypothetical protein
MKVLFLSLILLFSLHAQDKAETLFDAKCSSCHLKTKPQDMSSVVAPPIVGVMKHVNKRYRTKEKKINFINDYVMNPQKAKAVCKRKKLKHFGLMPSQKGNLTEAELHLISTWMVENFSSKKQGRNCN